MLITAADLRARKKWIAQIRLLSGNFGNDSNRLFAEAQTAFRKIDGSAFRNQLRLCGSIPESFRHDSSEEKLYSKYTDILASIAYTRIGIRSVVLVERGDAADVECISDDYEFVADAKAFRLTRTAKNAKDFKVPSLEKWKHHRQYATVICPLYHVPTRTSQIYRQAINHNVCIFSFSHLSLLTAYAEAASEEKARQLLKSIFRLVESSSPSKDAQDYWRMVNRCMLDFDPLIAQLWRDEKVASTEALTDAKQEALACLSQERSRIMRMNHDAAIAALINLRKLDAREQKVKSFKDNGLMELA